MNTGTVIVSTTIITFVALYPFYLKKYKNRRYRGLWKTLGELNQTPKRAILYPLGWVIGSLLVYLLNN